MLINLKKILSIKSNEARLGLICFLYWTTILITRAVIFSGYKLDGQGPFIMLRGFHLHHFYLGGFLLIVFLMIVLTKKKKVLSLPTLGIGMALIFDEFTFWINFKSTDYWAIGNFLSIITVGFFLTSAYFLLKRKNKKKYYSAQESIVKLGEPIISFAVSEFNKKRLVYLAGVRTAKLMVGKYVYFSILILVVLLFSFFYSLNPAISQAKSVGVIKQKGYYINRHLKNGGLELKNTFINLTK